MAISSELKKELTKRFAERVRFDEPMAAHTTFRVGGPADAFITVTDEDEMVSLVRMLKQKNLALFIMGGGTNLLVRDRGIRGVVVVMKSRLAEISVCGAGTVSAMAGASLNRLCRYALQNGLSGLNFALGIPGTVGGALRMNAGAWGRNMGDVLESIRFINPDGTIESARREDLTFSYRSLSFAASDRLDMSSCIILEGRFVLSPGNPDTLTSEAEELLNARRTAQPAGVASAGCFFKNPVDEAPAGKLMDLAGAKGLCFGDAQVSEKHANFIINRGRASANDIIRLMKMVQGMVYNKFKIMLEPEVKIVGDE